MWPAVLDTRTLQFPEGEHTPRRVYRLIGAPSGSTLYWDQPSVVAAYRLGTVFGRREIAHRADAYIDSFLAHCRDDDGVFLWGNHQYYDVFEGKTVSFSGGHHELRPITPAWKLFASRDQAATERYLHTVIPRHLYDEGAGGFNRHDDRKRDHAFLESGGVLVESAAWLAAETGDRELAETACRIARYSFGRRGSETGLLRNEPDHGRWDSLVCTTEVGLWAGCLLRGAQYLGQRELREMAASAVDAFLKYAWDGEGYAGQVAVEDGNPVDPTEPGYWPRRYSDPWNTDQWPTHDYPMALGRTCIILYQLTGEERYLTAVRRLANSALRTCPSRTGRPAYAGNYGQVIWFLTETDRLLGGGDSYGAAARSVAAEAIHALHDGALFAGFPRGHRYEAVAGVGDLLVALLNLSTEETLDVYGLGF